MDLDGKIADYTNALLDELRGAPGPPDYDVTMRIDFLRENIDELQKLKARNAMILEKSHDLEHRYWEDSTPPWFFSAGANRRENDPVPVFVDPDLFIELEEGLL